jgi:hypothetical protein
MKSKEKLCSLSLTLQIVGRSSLIIFPMRDLHEIYADLYWSISLSLLEGSVCCLFTESLVLLTLGDFSILLEAR